MAVEVVVPGLGLGWSSGRIIHWYQPDGSQVSRGEPVFCLETDFVAIDVEADADGVVRHRPHDPEAMESGAVAALILAPGERLPEEPGEPAGHEAPDGTVMDAPHAEPQPEPVERPRRYAFERWEVIPEPGTDDEPAPFDFSTALPSSLDPEPPTGSPAAAMDATPEPPPILPLRRNTLPAPPPIADDSPWTPVPGDEVAVAGGWNQAPDEGADDTQNAWDAPEPPVKHPDEDPRAYFDVAPFAPGVTPIHADETDHREEAGGFAPPFEPRAEPAGEPNAAPAAPAALTLRTLVDLREVRKMRAQLAREWRTLEPTDEDVLLRAASRALREAGHDPSIALIVPGEAGDDVAIGLAEGGFREAVEALRNGGSDQTTAASSLTTFAAYGIDEAAPALAPGHAWAIAAGAVREFAVVEGDRAVPVPMLALVAAYDPAAITAGSAAAMLGRIRELLEAPYALLAA